jgi:hypothetical protein
MFLTNQPALVVDGWLCVADLHLGITRELFEAGVRLPSQVKDFVERIHKMKKAAKATGLILLGDVKHKVPGISYQEMREIPEFLESLKFKKIVLVKGNHDAEIEKIIPSHLKGKVVVRKSFKVGDFLFTHGHMNVKLTSTEGASNKQKGKPVKTIVIGHNQPGVLFRDAVKATYIEPCWVRGPLKGKYKGKELIIVPAFNDLRGHGIVNKGEMLGPIAKHIDKKEAHAYLLDGTDLGTLAQLKRPED